MNEKKGYEDTSGTSDRRLSSKRWCWEKQRVSEPGDLSCGDGATMWSC